MTPDRPHDQAVLPPLIRRPSHALGGPVRGWSLRRRLHKSLAEISADPAEGAPGLIRSLSDHLGRSIEVHERGMLMPGPFSVTVEDDQGFVIFVQEDTTADHKTHLLLHEWAHIAFDTMVDTSELLRQTHDADSRYSSQIEQDAEFVALALNVWINANVSLGGYAKLTDARLRRLAAAFDERIGAA